MLKKSKVVALLVVCVMMFAVVQPACAKTYYICRKCNKVADSVFGKWGAGACSGFFHDWKEENSVLDNPQYQKRVEETQSQAAAENWWMGHSLGWW